MIGEVKDLTDLIKVCQIRSRHRRRDSSGNRNKNYEEFKKVYKGVLDNGFERTRVISSPSDISNIKSAEKIKYGTEIKTVTIDMPFLGMEQAILKNNKRLIPVKKATRRKIQAQEEPKLTDAKSKKQSETSTEVSHNTLRPTSKRSEEIRLTQQVIDRLCRETYKSSKTGNIENFEEAANTKELVDRWAKKKTKSASIYNETHQNPTRAFEDKILNLDIIDRYRGREKYPPDQHNERSTKSSTMVEGLLAQKFVDIRKRKKKSHKDVSQPVNILDEALLTQQILGKLIKKDTAVGKRDIIQNHSKFLENTKEEIDEVTLQLEAINCLISKRKYMEKVHKKPTYKPKKKSERHQECVNKKCLATLNVMQQKLKKLDEKYFSKPKIVYKNIMEVYKESSNVEILYENNRSNLDLRLDETLLGIKKELDTIANNDIASANEIPGNHSTDMNLRPKTTLDQHATGKVLSKKLLDEINALTSANDVANSQSQHVNKFTINTLLVDNGGCTKEQRLLHNPPPEKLLKESDASSHSVTKKSISKNVSFKEIVDSDFSVNTVPIEVAEKTTSITSEIFTIQDEAASSCTPKNANKVSFKDMLHEAPTTNENEQNSTSEKTTSTTSVVLRIQADAALSYSLKSANKVSLKDISHEAPTTNENELHSTLEKTTSTTSKVLRIQADAAASFTLKSANKVRLKDMSHAAPTTNDKEENSTHKAHITNDKEQNSTLASNKNYYAHQDSRHVEKEEKKSYDPRNLSFKRPSYLDDTNYVKTESYARIIDSTESWLTRYRALQQDEVDVEAFCEGLCNIAKDDDTQTSDRLTQKPQYNQYNDDSFSEVKKYSDKNSPGRCKERTKFSTTREHSDGSHHVTFIDNNIQVLDKEEKKPDKNDVDNFYDNELLQKTICKSEYLAKHFSTAQPSIKVFSASNRYIRTNLFNYDEPKSDANQPSIENLVENLNMGLQNSIYYRADES